MYVTFLRKDEALHETSPLGDDVESAQDGVVNQEGLNESGIALVCVGAGGDFETIRGWCDSAILVRFILFSFLLHSAILRK